MAKVFSWNDVYDRRRTIATEVQRQIGMSFSLGVEEPFHTLMLTDQDLADQPMWRVPFYVLAHRLEEAVPQYHVIDHAWWLIAQDRSNEPWGFVTEPYIPQKSAQQLAKAVQRRHDRWGVDIWTLPPAQSAWLPNNTTPIIVTVRAGCLRDFLRLGVAAALNASKLIGDGDGR